MSEEKIPISERAWRETLAQMTEKQLREFEEKVLRQEDRWQELLVLQYGSQRQRNSDAIQRWKLRAEKIAESCRSYDGNIDYEKAYRFYTELSEFVEERYPILIARKEYMEAFSLVCAVYQVAMEEEADDSDGGMSWLMDSCKNAWEKILSEVSEEQETQIYRYFERHAKSDHSCFGGALLEEFLYQHIWSDRFLENNLSELDCRLAENGNDENECRCLIQWKENIMQVLRRSDTEIDAFLDEWKQFPFVRDRQTERLIDRKRYDEAIALLQKERVQSEGNLPREKQISETLLRIYQSTGQAENYREELLLQISNFMQYDMQHIRELRDITPEREWPQCVEWLLTLGTTAPQHKQIMAENRMWEQLFTVIAQEESLYALECYLEPLMRWNTEETMACFSRLIDKAMQTANHRKAYYSVLHRLRAIQSFDGGKTQIARLLNKWEKQYPRRSAMQDEIQRIRREAIL